MEETRRTAGKSGSGVVLPAMILDFLSNGGLSGLLGFGLGLEFGAPLLSGIVRIEKRQKYTREERGLWVEVKWGTYGLCRTRRRSHGRITCIKWEDRRLW